ncbi:TPA: E2/UBC family protein [Vibrio parahaemolyticus]
MPLFLDEDYIALKERSVSYIEDVTQRFFVIQDYKLPEGVYRQEFCDVLVVIPKNYPQAGNDMFWTNPRLVRSDGKVIPQTNNEGAGDNRRYNEKEFCRWSRHWNRGPSIWQPGKDNVVTILRRLDWAFRRPDAR